MILGGHVSASGGPLKALQRAVDLEFSALQIHPSSPQTWAKPTISEEECVSFAALYPTKGIQGVFFHNIYLTNFASDNPAGWHGTISISQSYLKLADAMGAHGIVTHLGSHKGAGMEAVLDRTVEGISRALEESPRSAYFLIENTAGAGGTIGRTLEEIEMIITPLQKKYQNIGICIDTCHAFASGIPIHLPEGLQLFVDEFKQRFGWEMLRCLHLNDSKGAFDSNKDRHENIGDGAIGLEGFRHILNHPDIQKVPWIMEVPGIEKTGPDAENRDRIYAITRERAPRALPVGEAGGSL